MNYMEAAIAPAEAADKARIERMAWGHLAPGSGEVYEGHILFSFTAWGVWFLVDADFAGLECSPWLYDHMNDFIGEQDVESGHVYRFEGKYRVFKNGNYRFTGKTKQVL